jgi:peptide/nickel transport system permease protein
VVGASLTRCWLAALLSLVWTPYPPAEIDIPAKLQGPSAAHWLGTDSLGRDIASAAAGGGAEQHRGGRGGGGHRPGRAWRWAAWHRRRASGKGWVEELIMRASDFTFAFPALLSAIMLTAIYGPGLVMSIVAIGIFNIPVFARITRGAANAVWARDYVTAARACRQGAAGASRWTTCCPTSPAS